MTDQRCYFIHGLVIRSAIPLTEPEVSGATVDLTVDLDPPAPLPPGRPVGETVADLVLADRVWYSVTSTTDGLVVRFPDLADFIIKRAPANAIVCRPDIHCDPRALPLLLTGTVLSVFLVLSGELVLHASAVEFGGRAVAFTGLSGMGKSTCAALACAAGASLIADDVLVVKDSGEKRCVRGTSSLRLRPNAADILLQFETPPPSWDTVDHRRAIAPVRSQEEVPMAALVIPRPDKGTDDLRLQRREPSEVIRHLLSFTRIPGWRSETLQRQQFLQLAGLANVVPVYDAWIPWGPPLDKGPIGQLLAVLATGPDDDNLM